MTPHQINRIRESWSRLKEVDPALVGEVFYSRLFAEAPGVQHMFSQSKAEQGRKLMSMLSLMLNKLGQEQDLQDELEKLASRHVQYGVKERHYEQVGKSLLWTLQKALADIWDENLEAAWLAWYQKVADVMKKASYAPKEKEVPGRK